MTAEAQARAVVEGMLARDRFSAWLGLELISVAPGASTSETHSGCSQMTEGR